jgi:hypothetical protein
MTRWSRAVLIFVTRHADRVTAVFDRRSALLGIPILASMKHEPVPPFLHPLTLRHRAHDYKRKLRQDTCGRLHADRVTECLAVFDQPSALLGIPILASMKHEPVPPFLHPLTLRH